MCISSGKVIAMEAHKWGDHQYQLKTWEEFREVYLKMLHHYRTEFTRDFLSYCLICLISSLRLENRVVLMCTMFISNIRIIHSIIYIFFRLSDQKQLFYLVTLCMESPPMFPLRAVLAYSCTFENNWKDKW